MDWFFNATPGVQLSIIILILFSTVGLFMGKGNKNGGNGGKSNSAPPSNSEGK